MDKKKLLLIGLGSFGVLLAIILALAFLVPKEGEESNTKPLANVDTTLSEQEKLELKSSTETFITELGNYGWYPDLIKNPQNSSDVFTDDFFLAQEHTSPEESRQVLRTLSKSRELDGLVNEDAYNSPFAVETSLAGEISIPNKPVAEGSRTVVTVTVPLESKLSYISTTMSFMGDDGKFVDPETFIRSADFEGELTLKFTEKDNSWALSSVESNLGVLATDSFFVVNGDLVVDTATPVKEDSVKVTP